MIVGKGFYEVELILYAKTNRTCVKDLRVTSNYKHYFLQIIYIRMVQFHKKSEQRSPNQPDYKRKAAKIIGICTLTTQNVNC